ncbi:MAG: glycine cleavage system aminomethyltransferase GcvT [Nitrospira sp.]|nr:glycine cleavage system aminomethyltransferase GcvT [Nitrospira sp.]
MKRTPLYEGHVAAGAKLVDFAGWEMPIQYSGVVDEYQTVRTAAGLFDVSHMGRVLVSGPGALPFLQGVTTNDVAKLAVLESHYSMVCNQQGGILDDIFVYRIKPQEYYLCVNASNREKIVAWLKKQATGASGFTIADRSAEVAQLALQGPASRAILNNLGVKAIDAVKPRHCLEASLCGADVLITRTGYTGELGYELYLAADRALSIWNELLRAGKSAGLKPAGLGSRDLLRLEMAYLLYGNDISEDISPIEAGAGWVVNFEKGDFIGRAVLAKQKDGGLTRRLAAFELLQKAVPRHGFKILVDGGKEVGEVTSGNLSPILQKGIGLGYVPPALASVGSSFTIDIRGRAVPAVVVKPPFYKRKNRDG